MKDAPALYAVLAELNSNLNQCADIIRELRQAPALRSATLRLIETQLRELRALVCSELVERLAEHEATVASRYGRKRKGLEWKLKDEAG